MTRATGTSLFLAVFLALSLASDCLAGVNVRVMVMDDLERLAIYFPGSYDVKDVTGLGVVSSEGGAGSRIELGPDTHVPSGIRIRAEDSIVSINEFGLTGIIDVKRNRKGLFTIINELDLEDYTRAVVGEEMGPGWPIEALKAQAVASRTYALNRKSKCGPDGYDLCSTVNSQMFTGDAWIKEGPARAAEETKGLVLTYRGEPAETLYHSSCGGATEDSANVWAKGREYLISVDCSCNLVSPNAQWSRTLAPDELKKSLEAAGYNPGVVEGVSVSRRSGSGRASTVKVTGSDGTLSISGNDFRRVLGYTKLPGTMFSVRKTAEGFVFTGSGSGHGVGLCQWGAKALAEEGWTFEKILAHYYPGLTIAVIDESGGGESGAR